jgi:hypothetical protein
LPAWNSTKNCKIFKKVSIPILNEAELENALVPECITPCAMPRQKKPKIHINKVDLVRYGEKNGDCEDPDTFY